MSNSPNQNSAVAQYLASSRNQCLSYYMGLLRTSNLPFMPQDELLERVRAGSVLDALIDGLYRNQLDNLNGFLQETAHQLLSAGYNFEQIRIRYDFLERSIEATLDSWDNAEQMRYVAQRSIKSVLQLGRMIAVNEYMARFNSSFEGQAVNRRDGSSSTKNSSTRPLPGATPVAAQFAVPDAAPSPPRSPYRSNPAPSGSTYPVGYLEWPLKVVPGSRPPEYYAYLTDGKPVQTLLVDSVESYTRHGKIGNNTLSCRIRQVGPLVLAYPF